MVDLDKLRTRRRSVAPQEPREIFLRLPKSPGFDDLWSSQAEALDNWSNRRNDRDVVIKMNTGGGKTLVGLLIAQSIINELRGPVVYLCPNSQLQGQVIHQSNQYGISTIAYPTGAGNPLPEEFLGADSILVGTYHSLFNGRSKFGISGSRAGSVELKGIILDDAHTSFSTIRDIFSLPITRDDHEDLYDEFATLFRDDFARQGRQGTYDDVVAGQEDVIFEIPYVSWLNRMGEIRQRMADVVAPSQPFAWPLIRDHFEHCHALLSKDQLVITPLYPIMDLFPSFTDCPRRVYMSATVADDSDIIRTFDASSETISKPVSPTSLAGVGERMILTPGLTRLERNKVGGLAKQLAKDVSKSAGVAILAPSNNAAEQWSDIAKLAKGDEVANAVHGLVNSSGTGPYVFPNRYDGIDLPGDSCRLLILAGLPRGNNVYDSYRATVLDGSATINSNLAQRIEQGMGRGTRGGGDHCVVILLGNDLVSWISLSSNLRLLTATTREQVRMGTEISREITSIPEFRNTVDWCLERSPVWTQFHASELADSTGHLQPNIRSLDIAAEERRHFNLLLSGYAGKAANATEKFVREKDQLDDKVKGWLLQLAARAAHQAGNIELRERLQREAHACNRALQRPMATIDYTPLSTPTDQSKSIVGYINRFELRRGVLARFDEIAANLVKSATAGQFEEALKDLGSVLGFASERPETKDKGAPDVLWILGDDLAWVMECKSTKKPDNPLSKQEHGQLLQSWEWFNQHYPNHDGTRISLHPNTSAGEGVTPGDTMVLTMPKLGELVGSMRTLLEELTTESLMDPLLLARCETKLEELRLRPSQITGRFLAPLGVNQ